MRRIMKRIGKMTIVCLLMVALLVGSTASAAGLLEAMVDIALRAGRTIESTFRIEGGAFLAAIGSGLLGYDDDAIATVSELLNNGLLRVRYTKVDEQDVVGMVLELRGEVVASLDVQMQEGQFALETNLLPGKTLVMPVESSMQSFVTQNPVTQDTELMEVLAGVAERYGALIEDWINRSENAVSLTSYEVPIDATQTRDAISSSNTIRITGAQLSALVHNLVEEFVKDTALQQALSPHFNGMDPMTLASFAQQIDQSMGVALDYMMEITISHGMGDKLVGIDMGIYAQTETAIEGSSAEGYQPSLQVHFDRKDITADNPLDKRIEYVAGITFGIPVSDTLTIAVKGNLYEKVEPIDESYHHFAHVEISQGNQVLPSDDPAQVQMQGDISINNDTKVIVSDDFVHQGAFALQMMGQQVAIRYTIESTRYKPQAYPGNSIIRLDMLSSEESDALTQELQVAVMGALGKLLSTTSQLPVENPVQQPVQNPVQEPVHEPALKTYTVEDESVPSLDSIVGFREISKSGSGISYGEPYVEVEYQSESAKDDLLQYLYTLVGSGFVFIKTEGDFQNGDGIVQLGIESAIDGKTLVITIDTTLHSNSVRLQRVNSAFRRYETEAGGQAGELVEAGTPIQPADVSTQDDPAVMEHGRIAIENGAFEDALSIFEAALTEHPDIAAYHGGRGEALVGLARYQEALGPLNTAIQLDPNCWIYVNERGVAYFYLNELEHSMVDFKRAEQLGPETTDAHINLGTVQRELGLLEDSVQTFARGIAEFPDSNEILWLLLGDSQVALKHYEQALYAYHQGMAYGNFTPEDIPNYAEAHENAPNADQ